MELKRLTKDAWRIYYNGRFKGYLTDYGKGYANQLAKGEAISRDTIARMAAFERHRQNSDKELGDGCGRLMWLAWGGDEGIEWAQRKLKQIEDGKA